MSKSRNIALTGFDVFLFWIFDGNKFEFNLIELNIHKAN